MTQAAKGVYVPTLAEKNPLKQNQAIQQLARGQTNALGSFTLTSGVGATTTTVSNVLVTPNTVVLWMPTTQSAYSIDAALYLPTTDVSTGQFIVHHASSTSTDRIFNYVLHS